MATNEEFPGDYIEREIIQVGSNMGMKWKAEFMYIDDAPHSPEEPLDPLFKSRLLYCQPESRLIDTDFKLPNGQTKGEHLFIINTNGVAEQELKLLPLDYYRIALAALTELDPIFGEIPFIYDKQNEKEEIEKLRTTIQLCDRTTMVWAFDLINQNYPDVLQTLLATQTKRKLALLDRTITKMHESNEPFTNDQIGVISDAWIHFALLKDRYGYLKNKKLINRVNELFDKIPELLLMAKDAGNLYKFLPKMPTKREGALKILQRTTLHHAMTLQLFEHDFANFRVQAFFSNENYPQNYYHGWVNNESMYARLG